VARRSAPRLRCPALLLAAACCGGCTITKLEHDNDAAAQRIRLKSEDLEHAEAQQAQLADAKARLLHDLRSREVSAQELARQLDALGRLNEATAASNAQMLQHKQQTARTLEDAAGQLAAARQPVAGEPPGAAAKRLAESRQKIRAQLELMLAN
jgi:DNA anti-recombination protein RmuC